MSQDALFCVAQKAFIEKDGKVLVLSDPQDGLDFPGGKIQEGEAVLGEPASLTRALEREVQEETGLTIEVGSPFVVWYYEFPQGHRNYPKVVMNVGFKCAYISGEVCLSNEHSNFTWVDKDTYRAFTEADGYFGALQKYFD